MTENKNIPKHWKITKLGLVCDVLDNLRKPINTVERQNRNAGKLTSELFPYYGATGQVGWIDGFLTNGEYILIGEDGAPFLDLLKNKAYKIKGKTWVNNHAHILKGKVEIVIDDYVLYYLNSINYRDYVNGTTRLKLTKSNLVDIPFILPPLPEQLTIVSKIEELFSELDNGKQQLLTAQQQLKVYRQSLLKAAFEGKLTAEWRNAQTQNGNDGLAIAAEPEAKYGNSMELPEGWLLNKFTDIGTWKGGGTPSKLRNDFWEDGNIFWVSPKDMKSQRINDTIDKITLDAIEHSSAKLIPKGSILFVVRSGILRRTLPIAITMCDVTVNQDIQAFTPYKVSSEYIYWYVSAKNDDIRKKCSKDGTTVESIESLLLKNYYVPICSLYEQQLIVDQLESKLTVCDKIEETIAQSLLQAETLRQSILKKAFEGKLTC